MKRRWTQADMDFIRENYADMTSEELAEHLGASVSSIKNKLNKMGMRKYTNAGRFKKGFVPWNKGVKGLHYSRATEFKKGHVSANTLHNGAIRLRYHKKSKAPIYFIRIAPMKWITLNRYNWEKANGPIPKGYVVRHKDGNFLNDNIENLELVSRGEHLQRCHQDHTSDGYIAGLMSHHDPELRKMIKKNPELIELKKKQILFRRELGLKKTA